MNRLYGKTILVGRSQQGNTLHISVVGTGKVGVLNRQVPGSVSRLDPTSGIAHMSITLDAKGSITAKNLKDANCTYVNGQEIRAKAIQPAAVLELGKDHFSIPVNEILEAAKKLIGPTPPPNPDHDHDPKPKPKLTFNVHHLRRIWDDYKAACKQIQIDRIIAQRKQRIPFIVSGVVGGPITILASKTHIEWLPWITGMLTAGIMAYFMFRDPSIELTEKKEQLDKDLERMYVCPNPECNKMLPKNDIDFILKQNDHKCPYCKSQYVDKA